MKLLQGKIGESLDYPGFGDEILDTTAKAWSMYEITVKLNFVKMKNSVLRKTLSQE